jgi:hypothetical protein
VARQRLAVWLYVLSALVYSVWFTEARFAVHGTRERLGDHLSPPPGKPSRHRVLTALAARALAASSSTTGARGSAAGAAPAPTPHALEEAFRRIELIATFLLALAFWYYLALVLGSETEAALLAPVLFAVLPFHYLIPHKGLYFTPFDVPGVMFFTLGLALLRAENWAALYPVLALGMLNRETMAFLPVVWLLVALGRRPAVQYLAHAAGQVGVVVGVKWALARTVGGNLIEIHFAHNLEVLTDPTHVPLLASAAGFLWVPLLLVWRRIPDDFARRSTLVAVPFVAGMIAVGQVLELRIFGELVPIVLAAYLCALRGRPVQRSAFSAATGPITPAERGDA